jgi:hypothetical protein
MTMSGAALRAMADQLARHRRRDAATLVPGESEVRNLDPIVVRRSLERGRAHHFALVSRDVSRPGWRETTRRVELRHQGTCVSRRRRQIDVGAGDGPVAFDAQKLECDAGRTITRVTSEL